ncbi:TetR/AcrR family transcriptional regulator [Massilia arenosa]|uniref:TetR/AcrR family transcriptional regulator n=1 Tax=Zemynaea arenosa TaxID=2561931 RepID=A0A4Y9SM07_9BURK|nr:TetR/AcrR family transcriptional regulator [Massilia arenosa]TFW23148.1 TetR/AcrR family transcriptional regulator [Massilia arenosa]
MSQPESTPPKRRPGRPPSEHSRRQVLDTAYRILMTEGLGRLSIERVAAEAGVSKPTIYRSWTNAQELAMAALMAQPGGEASAPLAGAARAALETHLRAVIDTFATQRGRQIALTMASADPDSELAKAFRNQVILKSRETGRTLIEQAIADREIRADVDVEVVLDMLFGPLFFRLLVGHLSLSPALAGALVNTVFDGLAEMENTPAAARGRRTGHVKQGA